MNINNDNMNFTITLPCKASFDDFTQDELNAIAKFLQLYIPADKTISEILLDPKDCSEELVSIKYTTEEKNGINIPNINVNKFIESINKEYDINLDRIYLKFTNNLPSSILFSSIYYFDKLDKSKVGFDKTEIKSIKWIYDQILKMEDIISLSIKLLDSFSEFTFSNIYNDITNIVIVLEKDKDLSIKFPVGILQDIVLYPKKYVFYNFGVSESEYKKSFQYPYGDLMTSLKYVYENE